MPPPDTVCDPSGIVGVCPVLHPRGHREHRGGGIGSEHEKAGPAGGSSHGPASIVKGDGIGSKRGNQASNDLPQPQDWRALGLVILKPPPVRASEKSMTAPLR